MRLTKAVGFSCIVVALGLTAVRVPAAIQAPSGAPSHQALLESGSNEHAPTPWSDLVGLPVAAALGAALAFRPVRRGTPARDPAVIQTQIVLAVVGALIMMVVGASLARAFGILGAANLVRYRAKIGDPKDAAVMLVALAVGLAAGIGLYLPAAAATAFILLLLWALESIEPAPVKAFELKLKGDSAADIRPKVEQLLREQHLSYELRATGQEELSYQVILPARRRTSRLAAAVLALDPDRHLTVELEPLKKKKG
jgi:uncharacterized membrane protein YhiD involved in acid resistance